MTKIVLVTGASRGIGAATALLAAEHGYDVALGYRANQREAAAVADGCRALGRRAITVQADMAVEAEVVAMFEAVDAELGRVDALVNNAGTLWPQARLDTFSAERVAGVLAVNVVGAIVAAREAVRRMSTVHGGDGGVIVNVSSKAAVLGSPGEWIDYAASKGAVDTMTVGLAKEVAAEGIRVCGVRPGLILTDIHAMGGEPGRPERMAPTVPMARAGEPAEVAAAIVWLLTDEASYVTGAILDVAGGR